MTLKNVFMHNYSYANDNVYTYLMGKKLKTFDNYIVD